MSSILSPRSPAMLAPGEWKFPGVTDGGRRAVGGFTLLELMAVLLVLAAALAVSLPFIARSTGGSSTELRAAARIVAAGLRQTRDRAISANRAAAMQFDVELRRIRLGPRTRHLPRWLRFGLFTARSERVDATRGNIRFFPDGSSTGGRVMLGTNHRSLSVDVDWLTGRVSLLEGEPQDWDAPTAFETVRIE